MLLVKAVTVIIAGCLSILAFRHVVNGLNAAKVRVRAKRDGNPRPVTRLRQDPRTGIYYPEN